MTEQLKIKAEKRAKFLIKQLGKEGALVQVAEEWGNAGTDEEREYQNLVGDIIRETKCPNN